MTARQAVTATLGLAAIAGVWLLATSISRFEFQDGVFYLPTAPDAVGDVVPRATPQGPPLPDWAKVVLLLGLWGVFLVSLVAVVFKPRLLAVVLKRAAVFAMWVLVAFALSRVVAQVGSLFGGGNGPSGAPGQIAPIDPATFPNPDQIVMPWWTQWLASGLAVALGAWLLLRLRRGLAALPCETDFETALAEGAGSAARALRRGAPLQEAVLRCYERMCELLAARQRRAVTTLTPREFEAQLAQVGIVDANITDLSRLFERVRYSAHPAMSEDRQLALSCLDNIERLYRSRK